MNSFRFVEKALDFEIRRQMKVLEEGGRMVQETRLWDDVTGTTQPMRTKEEAHDYRYFPAPDLVPLVVGSEWVAELRSGLPELPDDKRNRFITGYGLPEYDAEILTSERAVADWYEGAVRAGGRPKTVSNWMMTELMRLLNEENLSIEECPLEPEQLADLLRLIDEGTISGKIAKTVFEEMYTRSKSVVVTPPVLKVTIEALKPEVIVKERGLVQISDEGAIEKMVEEVLAKSPKEVERYKSGDEKLLGFFVGQVMKATRGKANPQIVNDLLRRRLS
jgi:aspartyl-tRNA(Asn)/glutamyl-tRNA(Gln) amidotransferase subunit B